MRFLRASAALALCLSAVALTACHGHVTPTQPSPPPVVETPEQNAERRCLRLIPDRHEPEFSQCLATVRDPGAGIEQ